MASLTNPLNIKNRNISYPCICYTTVDEATPKTVSGGSYWQIKNNNTTCYVGLWPVSAGGGEYHSPLRIKKNGIEYFVETKVVNTYRITIEQTSNQTIKVTYNGVVYTGSFDIPAGAAYTVTVTPNTGYTAGAPSVTSGNANKNMTIYASPASKAQYLITITQTTGQTIYVTCNGVVYTSSFTANYGDTWTAKVEAAYGYNTGSLNTSSGTIKGAVTISASSASLKKYTVTVTLNPYDSDPWPIINGTTYSSNTTLSFNHGTNVTVKPDYWDACDYLSITHNGTTKTIYSGEFSFTIVSNATIVIEGYYYDYGK